MGAKTTLQKELLQKEATGKLTTTEAEQLKHIKIPLRKLFANKK